MFSVNFLSMFDCIEVDETFLVRRVVSGQTTHCTELYFDFGWKYCIW